MLTRGGNKICAFSRTKIAKVEDVALLSGQKIPEEIVQFVPEGKL